ncbi:MAG TPA: IS1595 family transposase [Acidimicrobiales bacterium]|nr:IS1595 family transposase [Acidimicrobiales bacterium]
MRTTVTALADKLQTEADAWEFLEGLRWPNGPACPRCQGTDVYLIVPKNGVSRRTSSGSMSERRAWQCRPCRRQFTATTGTMMHGTKIPLRTWVLVIFEMCASKNGVAAREIERKYGLCARSAWFLMHRIREAMRNDALVGAMRGTIQMDETWVGGDPKNWHQQGRKRYSGEYRKTKKAIVFSLINADTGEVRSRVVPNVTGHVLRKALAEQVDMANSVLYTDAALRYRGIGQEFIAHEWVDHEAREYARGGVTVNRAEGYFSQLKRSIDGTHHHVSREHLARYLAEFDYRYTTKHLTDGDRMAALVERGEGRRLTYKRVRTR